MTPLEKQFALSIDYLHKVKPFPVDIGLILGSGLGDYADSLKPELSISTTVVPDYPASTVVGHSGKIHFARFYDKNLLIFQGRIHYYEGYSLRQCLLPVELSFHMGARKMLITNAAGGINPNFFPGDLMLATGFNSHYLKKEISQVLGVGNINRRNRLITLSTADLNGKIRLAAQLEGQKLQEGVYFYTKGPNYETPAEVGFIRRTGGDAVGMSSVHEAIYAEHLGISTGMISCISNFAAGITPNKLDHSEVTETANLVKNKFSALISRTISLL